MMMIGNRLYPNYHSIMKCLMCWKLFYQLRSVPTQHNLVLLLPLCVSAGCWGREMCRWMKGGVGAEEKGTGGGINRRGLGEDRWNNNLAVLCLCANSAVYSVSGVYLGFVFCNSCAFLWEAEMRREGLAVQCLFSIRLLSLGRQLLSQLLPESPWQHLPLWAGRKTMPNIRKKQNHCLHMSRDCPPLVCLLRPVIANLCKTIPVAKEEGALERNILVRKQYKRRALLGQAFYRSSLPWWSLTDSAHQYSDPSPTQITASTQMDPVCSSSTVVAGYGSHFEKVDGQSHKIDHRLIHHHCCCSQLRMSILHLT